MSTTISTSGSTAPSQPTTPSAAEHDDEARRTPCSVMWPASMLANRRTLWEIGRDRNDSTSMNDDQRQDVDRDALGHEQLEELQPVPPEAVDRGR